MNEKLILAITALATALAEWFNKGTVKAATGETTTGETTTGDGEATPPARRGRPPGATAKPRETAAGPTDEERLASNRALIQPLIKDKKGKEVKAIIIKHGGTELANLPADKQEAFEQDIEALTM